MKKFTKVSLWMMTLVFSFTLVFAQAQKSAVPQSEVEKQAYLKAKYEKETALKAVKDADKTAAVDVEIDPNFVVSQQMVQKITEVTKQVPSINMASVKIKPYKPYNSPKAVLYSQMTPATNGGSCQDFEASFDIYDAMGADDFTVSGGPWNIQKISWLGSNSNGVNGSDFNIEFYNDNAGAIGTLVASYPANFTTEDGAGLYTSYLAAPLALADGTYWIKIQARWDFGTWGQYYWTVHDPLTTYPAEAVWQNPADGFGTGFTTWTGINTVWPDAPGSYDFCFELSDDPPPSCIDPSGIGAGNYTASTADIFWTENGSATMWNLEWGVAGFVQGTGTLVSGLTSTMATLSGLAGSTTYDVYVQSDCGSGNVSNWVLFSFRLPDYFGAITPTPTCQTDAGAFLAEGIAWYEVTMDINEEYNFSCCNLDLECAGDMPVADADFTLYDIDGITQLWYIDGASGCGWDASTWGSAYESWTPPVSGTYYLKVEDYYETDADNFILGYISTLIPTCSAPENLTTTDITLVGAKANWDEMGTATMWNLEYGPAGFTQGTGTMVNGITVVLPPFGTGLPEYNITGLTLGTAYDWYVQADCGTDEVSDWVGPQPFTTLFPPPANDECIDAEAVVGPYPQVVMGSTNGATVDCAGVLDWDAVWYAIDLPYEYNYIELDLCLDRVEYFYDFDALTPGGYVADQLGGMWTTWSGAPGTAEDAMITTAQSNSPGNSFVVDAATIDLIYQLDAAPISTGHWMYSHYIYVPSGTSGYFNVQSDPIPGATWVVEVFFNDDGTGNVTQDITQTDFTYTQDTWIFVEIEFNLDGGSAEVFFDGASIYQWANTSTIGGIDYFGWDVGGTPGAYYDDVSFFDVSTILGNTGIILTSDCSCDPASFIYSTGEWAGSGNCLSDLNFEVQGPTTVYYPVQTDPKGDFTFDLNVTELSAPLAVIDPMTFDEDVPVDGMLDKTLSIGNDGGFPLDYTATIAWPLGNIVFEEDFESGTFPPVGWTEIQLGDPAGWVETELRANSPTHSAYHDDDNVAAGCDDWFITPALDLSALGTAQLSYFENVNFGTWADQHIVQYSTDYTGSGDPTLATWTLLNDAIGAEDTWVYMSYTLPSVAGVYVAFQYTGDYASEWFIDDVVVEEPAGVTGWLSLDGSVSVMGSVSSLESDDITVGFDATGLAPGTYTVDIEVVTNEPDLPETINYPINVTLNVVPGYNISGTLTYANAAMTPMDVVEIKLMDGTDEVAATQTDANGDFSIYFMDGTYDLIGVANKPAGGTSSQDLFLIRDFLTFAATLSPLQQLAGDLNWDGPPVTSQDLFLMRDFLTFVINDWTAPDYVFYSDPVTVSGGDVTGVVFQSLCSGDLNGDYTPPSFNDDCADAWAIEEVLDHPFSTVLATASGIGTCMTSADIWFVYTATADGTITVDLCDSDYDTKLAIYDGDCATLNELGCNDDDCGLQSAIYDIPVTAGTAYYIQVGGFSSNIGNGDISVIFTPAP